MKYPHLAARLFNTPLLVHPGKLDAIIAGLGGRLLGTPVELAPAADAAGIAPEMFSTRRGERGDSGYAITDGVAIVHASGALVHRSRMDGASSYLLGYNELATQVEAAQADPNVHAILQVWDSPGGEVSGAFEYAERMHAQRGKKPMWAIADSMAASAAYLGGSAFEHLAVSSTGYVGSIGVVMRHVDFSRALDNDGIRVTHIFAGSHKVDGNPYEPLPKDVQADMQAEIDGLYTLFVDAVAQHRGISADTVRATQARVYRGAAAVSMGLADRVATTDQLISELSAQRARTYPAGPSARTTATTTGEHMSGTTPPAPAGAAPNAATTAAPAAAAFTQADVDQARAEGHQAGAVAERERTSAILGHASAAANMPLAVTCVQNGLSAEQAGAILAAAPKPATLESTSTGNGFAAVMSAIGNPAVSGVEAAGAQGNDEAAIAAQIVASFNAAR
ncbi:MAG: S49 family peptidase [Giesbergeria sp.]|jgi:signal peptide peptidase SppA|nr:S49 family peptidase [Giesbergeria sp.]